ncbi:MAG: SDR family oxidoreductase [Planctomycetes bacterium]|nr:SDR family oxidoreductase [Planctomycetota bacterium]MCB9905132.1 SDR family oxidoreductase [Planctomycetota bacterium]
MSVPLRRALVTGASSGIGAATARALAEAGYRVVLLARRESELRAVHESLRENEHGEHLRVVCDLCDPAALEAALARVDAEFGGLELLVNNAGLGYRAKVEELDPALLERTFRTNVLAPFLLCKAALPLLRRGSEPVVVNIASVVGRRGIPGQTAYAASKSALCSFSEGLRIEWATEDIAVCTLNPALTATGFFEVQPNPSRLPDPDLSGAAGPDEVAAEVLRLARHPRPEHSMRKKWLALTALGLFAPRLADRLLARRLGGGWRAPKR